MTVTELQIGDWVYSAFSKYPCDIISIEHREGYSDNVRVNGVSGDKDIASLSPIPLTEKILEKNGFVFDGTQHWIIKSDELFISVCPVQPDNEWWDKFSTGIEVSSVIADVTIDGVKQIYVHQLQNSLRLCGIDKEIIL